MKSKWRSRPAADARTGLSATKKRWNAARSIWLYLMAGLMLLVVSCNTEKAEQGNAHAHPAAYTCPMHPQIVQEGPGSCPICGMRSEEHTSELQSLMRISYAVFCLKKTKNTHIN